jgi:hypothetical protein
MKKLALLVILALVLSTTSYAFAIDKVVVAEKGDFRLVRLEYGNQNLLEYAVTQKVTDKIQIFLSPGYDRANQPPLAKRLFEVRGVTDVILKPYGIQVSISPAFDREKMKVRVEQAILARYGIKR